MIFYKTISHNKFRQILVVDTLKKSVKICNVNYEWISYMAVFGDNVYTVSIDISSKISYAISIYKSDLDFSSNLAWNIFQSASSNSSQQNSSTSM